MSKNEKNIFEEEFYTVKGYSLQIDKELTESMEDYLEMISRLCKSKNYTRIKDISKALNVKASSSSKTVQKLKDRGYVKYEKYGFVQLTNKGRKEGEYLVYRHSIVENFLRLVGIKENLIRDTELIEHQITPTITKNLNYLVKFFEENEMLKEKFRSYQLKHELLKQNYECEKSN